jgi:hypothetical protein
MKIAAILWIALSAIIVWGIVALVIFAFGKNTYLKTADGRETNYYKKMGRIHLLVPDNVFSLILSPVSGADYRTFEPIDYLIARDKRYIYYHDEKQPKVDRETFEITEEGGMRDKNFRYRTASYPYRLVPIIENERYAKLETLIENTHPNKAKTGGRQDYDDDWIERVEKRLSFKLPDSYIWFVNRYGGILFGWGDRIKEITYPDFRPDHVTSILNQENRKIRGLSPERTDFHNRTASEALPAEAIRKAATARSG